MDETTDDRKGAVARIAGTFIGHKQQHRKRVHRFATLGLALLMFAVSACSDDDPTTPSPDTVAPTVNATNPQNGATGVAVITATFSEAMKASTISTGSFAVSGPGSTPVTGTVTYDADTQTATFDPISELAPGTAYTATVTSEVTDVAGNAMVNDRVWSFTTAASASNQLSVALGGAGAFAVLAGSTVTSTGNTALTGDVGVSPGTAITGFPPADLTGTKHAGDAVSATAMADLTTAYNDAAARTQSPVAVAGNIGGLTLPPGLYKSTSSLSISSGDLTLDAGGDANAVFVFQVASTLTTSSGRKVILSGGAKATNVFWQVGSSATLGTTSMFRGTIMAHQSITLNTGASLVGRALASLGAVTLAGNAVVIPTP